MNRRVIYRKLLIVMLLINLSALLLMSYEDMESKIPNAIKIIVNKSEKFNFDIPINANITTNDINVISLNNTSIPTNQIHFNLDEPFTLKSSKKGTYIIKLKLFGIFNFKKIELVVIDKVKLIPSGLPIGIYVETDGLMVLGTSSVPCSDGLKYEPALNILKSGDYITKINDNLVLNKGDLIGAIQNSNGKDVKLEVRRNNKKLVMNIKPIKTPNGEYKIGTWIRDNTQGIGTLTFIDSYGNFGALGHGITDVDTSLLLDIKEGAIYTTDIMQIIKGKKGVPGELVGLINKNEKNKIGDIDINTNQGIFGKLNDYFVDIDNMESMEIGLKQEIKLGKAFIRCQVEGEIKEYSIEIKKIELNNNNLSKGLVLSITDEELLDVTNGIVQGMSGSPIIQDNKLIGAVTHVFIQDASKGYGTFIENMLQMNNN